MAVTIPIMEDAFKRLYLPHVIDQLNTQTNPFYNEIKTSSNEVFGSDIRMAMSYGINGGIGAGDEYGALPIANRNKYKQAQYETKNIFGSLEISEKAIRASQSDKGAFVNLLNAEMEGVMKGAKFNFGRQLFLNGKGILTTTKANTDVTTLGVDSVQYLIEGLVIDILESDGTPKAMQREILMVDRADGEIKISGAAVTTAATDIIVVQGSYDFELTGLDAIFQDSGSLYGINRAENKWLIPHMETSVGAISDVKINKALRYADEIADSKINFLMCSGGVEDAYYAYLEDTRRNVNTMELKGGYKVLAFKDLPFVSDRFCQKQTMYLLNKDDFTFHQMGEWDWLQRDGSVLKQAVSATGRKAGWTATLIKFADLGCRKPIGQVKLSGITEG